MARPGWTILRGLPALVVLIGTAGCAAVRAPRFSVSTEAASHRVELDRGFSGGAAIALESSRGALIGGRGERVACQLVIRAGDALVTGVELVAEEAAGPSGAVLRDAARLYVQYPVRVAEFPAWYLRLNGGGRPREFLDILVPIDAPRRGQPFALQPGESLAVWAEWCIPAGAFPGRYHARVIVRSGDGAFVETPIAIDVLDCEMSRPPRPGVLARVDVRQLLSAQFGVDQADPLLLKLPGPAGDRARAVLRAAFEMLHAHDVSPYIDEVLPSMTLDANGHVTVSWTDYDGVVGPYLDGTAFADRIPVQGWPIPVGSSAPDPALYGGAQSALYARVLRETLEAAARHFQEKGWIRNAFVWFEGPHGLPPTRERLAHRERLARITHFADPGLRFVSSSIPQSMKPFGWTDHVFEELGDAVDIIAPPAQFQHVATLRRLRHLGRETWLLPDRPPFSGSLDLCAPTADPRSLPWQAFLMEHGFVWLPDVDVVPMDRIESRAGATRRGGAPLMYSGRFCGMDEPLPSLRLKQLALGVQEAGRLARLAALDQSETARLIASSLIKATGTDVYVDHFEDAELSRRVVDPAVWDMGGEIAARELAAVARAAADRTRNPAFTDPPSGARASGATHAAWDAFLRATRAVETWVESARLEMGGGSGGPAYDVELTVAARNDLPTAAIGRFRFGRLPADWTAEPGGSSLETLPPGGVLRQKLRARTTRIPLDLSGHCRLAVKFEAFRPDGARAGEADLSATLSASALPRASQSIQIDGDLRDWPLGEQNVLGDFAPVMDTQIVRVSGRPQGAAGGPADGLSRGTRTLAYVCADEESLYIAVRSATTGVDGAGAAADDARESPIGRAIRHNTIRYEELMPLGEEMVEILIDPTHGGTDSGDLFHVAVKASGSLVAERGVGTSPAIGRREAWPADVRYACTVSSDVWTTEVAIPLRAFGSVRGIGPVWGFNVTRYDTRRGEYTNWAWAARYCYNPRSMGNLVWNRLPEAFLGSETGGTP